MGFVPKHLAQWRAHYANEKRQRCYLEKHKHQLGKNAGVFLWFWNLKAKQRTRMKLLTAQGVPELNTVPGKRLDPLCLEASCRNS